MVGARYGRCPVKYGVVALVDSLVVMESHPHHMVGSGTEGLGPSIIAILLDLENRPITDQPHKIKESQKE